MMLLLPSVGFSVDVVIYLSLEELEQAREAHPKEFGWKESNSTWIRQTIQGKVQAKLFYRSI